MRLHTMRGFSSWCIAIAALSSSPAMLADVLSGSSSLLCHGLSAARCELDTGTCAVKSPWQLNLPDFLKVDLDAKRAETTVASGQQRQTPIRTVERANGLIVLQGFEGERAFSWLITEATGEGTMTMSSPEAGLTVFTVCTPIEKLVSQSTE
jgi:hypothetical protein